MNQIGILPEVIYSSIENFAQTGCLYAMPYVIYQINNDSIEINSLAQPLISIRENMKMQELEAIAKHNNDKDMVFMQMPRQAYEKMRSYAEQHAARVIADLTAIVVVSVTKKRQNENNIFFIDNKSHDKIIGRLGSLYLNNKKNTFCFVSYKPHSLLTNVTSMSKSELGFDINCFSNVDNKDHFTNAYPDDVQESIIQTVFFNVLPGEGYSPLRIDIFSQGLQDVTEKINQLKEIFNNVNDLSPALQIESRSLRLPRAFNDAIEANKQRFDREMSDRIEEFMIENNQKRN